MVWSCTVVALSAKMNKTTPHNNQIHFLVSCARPSRKTEGSGVTAIRDSFLSPRFTGNHTSHVLLMARVWLDNSTRIWRALARAYLHFCAHQLLIIHVPIIAFLQNELLIAVTPDPSVFLEGLARETNPLPSPRNSWTSGDQTAYGV